MRTGYASWKRRCAGATIYLPAQKIHFVRDNPRETAHLIIDNDSDVSRPTQRAHAYSSGRKSCVPSAPGGGADERPYFNGITKLNFFS